MKHRAKDTDPVRVVGLVVELWLAIVFLYFWAVRDMAAGLGFFILWQGVMWLNRLGAIR